MSTQGERITALETQIEELTKDYEAQQKIITALNEKLTKAEFWGRGVLWTLLAVVAVGSQLNRLYAWVKHDIFGV